MHKHIVTKHNGGQKAAGGALEVWDPMREMKGLRQTFADLLEDVLPGRNLVGLPALAGLPKSWTPAVDIEETEKEYLIKAELPGVEKKDILVQFRDGVLSLKAERKVEKEEKHRHMLRREQFYGSFVRSFALPQNARGEHAKCSYRDGILTIKVPRQGEVMPPGKEIPIE